MTDPTVPPLQGRSPLHLFFALFITQRHHVVTNTPVIFITTVKAASLKIISMLHKYLLLMV
jgi:hypothetical protein